MSSCQILTRSQIVELAEHFEKNEVNWNGINSIVNGCDKGTIGQKFQKVASILNASFESLEREGYLIFNSKTAIHKPYIDKYKEKFTPYRNVAELISKKVEKLKKESPELVGELETLEYNLYGMLYSLGVSCGGLDKRKNPDSATLEKLKKIVLDWKNTDSIIVDKNLNILEIQQLEEASKFPEFVNFIQNHEDLLERFLKWTIRDYNPIDVFVMCPNVQRRVNKALISSAIGRVRKPGNEEILKFEQVPHQIEGEKVSGVAKRILTLPFYHGDYTQVQKDQIERVNILDPKKEVHFKKGNYKVTLEEIEKKGSQKNDVEVTFNFSAAGMVNYHPTEGGYWDNDRKKFIKALGENKDNWSDFVPFADILSNDSVIKKYGKEMNQRKVIAQIISTRHVTNFQVMKTHAFWRFIIRMNQDQWKVIEPGFYPDEYPSNTCEEVLFFLNTRRRVMARNDQNGYYAHRQTGIYTPKDKEEDVVRLQKRVYREGIEERVFQFGGRNCTYPIDTLSRKYLKDVPFTFLTSLHHAKTNSPLDKIVAFFDKPWSPITYPIEFITQKYFNKITTSLADSLKNSKLNRLFKLIKEVLYITWLPIRLLGLHLFFAYLGYWRSVKIQKNGKTVERSMLEFLLKNPSIKIYHPGLLVAQIAEAKKTGIGPLKDAEFYWGNTSSKL